MIVGTGVDIVAVARIQAWIDAKKDGALTRAFTEQELAYCRQKGRPAESLAARFAAKEAVMKVLGTGWAEGIGFQQVEVVRDGRGKPGVELTGEAAERAGQLGIQTLHLSLSHTADHAVAFVVAEGPETGS